MLKKCLDNFCFSAPNNMSSSLDKLVLTFEFLSS